MLNELKLIVIFERTLELGSFRKAAKELKLSPSVISHHISQLENRLGVTLLYRSTRKLSATNEGALLFHSAKAMIAAAEEGLQAISSSTQFPTGMLNISVPSILARSPLVNDIVTFSELYPKVNLNINFSDEPKNLIRDRIDLAIRIGDLEDSSFKSTKLFRITRKLVVSPRAIKNKKAITKPDELFHYNWIGFNMLPNSRTLVHSDGTRFKAEFNPVISVDSVDAACQFAKAGAGLFTPPTFLIENELQSGSLIEILPSWQIEPLDAYLLWHVNASKSGLSGRFKDYLIARQKERDSQIKPKKAVART